MLALKFLERKQGSALYQVFCHLSCCAVWIQDVTCSSVLSTCFACRARSAGVSLTLKVSVIIAVICMTLDLFPIGDVFMLFSLPTSPGYRFFKVFGRSSCNSWQDVCLIDVLPPYLSGCAPYKLIFKSPGSKLAKWSRFLLPYFTFYGLGGYSSVCGSLPPHEIEWFDGLPKYERIWYLSIPAKLVCCLYVLASSFPVYPELKVPVSVAEVRRLSISVLVVHCPLTPGSGRFFY